MQYSILDEWDYLLERFPREKQDVYYSQKYVQLYEKDGLDAVCVLCRDDDKIMLIPFLRGQIGVFFDFETPYGYGGPIANTSDINWCMMAYLGIHDFLKKEGFLCGFTRFHPVLKNVDLTGYDKGTNNEEINILYNRRTISIDVSISEDEIWKNQISSKNRNMIRKAERNGLEYRSEFDFESLSGFIRLYSDTMKRLDADSFYLFEDEYFYSLRDSLPDNSFLATIRKDGRLICAGIFMYSKCYGHYHLAGSDSNYASLGANNLMLWKAACEMHRLGVKELHLGGGISSDEDDTLLRFKKVFGKENRSFFIGKEIFDSQEYARITEEWERNHPDFQDTYGRYLLKYRYCR